MKKTKTGPQNDNLTNTLKLLTKRIEEATVDIHRMKIDLGTIGLKFRVLETNIGVIKSDMEKMREDIAKAEKRIINEVGEFIADRILPQIDDKADKKDVERLEGKLDRLLHAN